jgi:hypothetical protein
VVIITLPQDDRDNLTDMIQSVLDDLFWRYDLSSLFFEEAILDFGNRTGVRYLNMKNAAESIGIDISNHPGGTATAGIIDLFHHNNNTAGRATFLFINNMIITQKVF